MTHPKFQHSFRFLPSFTGSLHISITGLILSLAAFLVLGCFAVLTDVPLPRTEGSSAQEAIAGSWMTDDGIIYIRFSEPGFAKIGTIDWDGEDFGIEHGELTLNETKNRYFLSARFMEDSEWPEEYLLAEVGLADGDVDYLLVWPPDHDRFTTAIEMGLLAGEAEGDVKITSKSDELLAVLADENIPYFDYRDPIVLRRVFDRPSPSQARDQGNVIDSESTTEETKAENPDPEVDPGG